MSMIRKGKSAEEHAAIASLKELRARDAVSATREYHQERQAIAARTERLRALRLAREHEIERQSSTTTGRITAEIKKAVDRTVSKRRTPDAGFGSR
jgi:hypothetical protein